jgi:hypothetical protein
VRCQLKADTRRPKPCGGLTAAAEAMIIEALLQLGCIAQVMTATTQSLIEVQQVNGSDVVPRWITPLVWRAHISLSLCRLMSC